MVAYWDDDERSLSHPIKYEPPAPQVISIGDILKQYYKEERARLYRNASTNNRNITSADVDSTSNHSFDLSEDFDMSEDYHGPPMEEVDYEQNADVLDKAASKKFWYS